MITAEIKLYEEPIPTWQQSNRGPYSLLIGQAKQDYETEFENEVEKAQKLLKVGDIVELNATQRSQVRILGFVEEPAKVIMFNQQMCVIYATFVTNSVENPIRYCLDELDLTTITSQKDTSNVS